MRLFIGAPLVSVLLGGSAGAGCGRVESTGHPAQRSEAAVQSPAAPLVARLKSLAAGAISVDDVAARAGSYVTSLSAVDKRLLAEALIAEKQPPYDVYGASILVSLGDEKGASDTFARYIVGGGDMTGFFWSWGHATDARTAPRMFVAIAEILLSRLAALTTEERDRAQRFLLADGFGPPIAVFSETAVRKRLEAIKREIASTPKRQ
jgi:hypothetical protein